MLEPVFKFDSSKDHYTADACVIWCFDDRFTGLLNAFTKAEGFEHYDLVRLAGGAKIFSEEDVPKTRHFFLGQIQKSRELHGTKRVVLMVHCDCGGYGGSKAFDGKDAEYAKLKTDLGNAEMFLRMNLPTSVSIEKYVADFDGLHRV